MTAILDFLHMGGYGGFIWPCYAATAVVLVGLLWISTRRLHRTETDLARLDPERSEQAEP